MTWRARLALLGVLSGCAGEGERTLDDYACTLDYETTERPDGEQIQGLLDAAVADGLPGVTLVIRHKYGDVFAASAGYADLELGAPMQPCTPMRVGAISQMMGSTALLSLVDDGMIGLDDTVPSVLTDSDVARIENIDQITVRQLLNHTSGIPDYALSECSLSQLNDAIDPLTPEAITRCVAAMPADFAPGADWAVSNTNYVLIGRILEALTDLPPSQVLANRVTTPMALGHTLLDERGIAPTGIARGYSDLSGQGDIYDLSDAAVGYGQIDAGVVSTANDLTVFAETLLIREFLSDASLAAMKTEARVNDEGQDYGLGLIVERESDWGKAFGHQGIMLGAMGEVWYLPNARTSVAILVNGSLGTIQDRALQLSHEELAPLLLATLVEAEGQ